MSEWNDDPRSYASGLVEDGKVPAALMIANLLCYMSHDDVRGALEANDLDPRFTDEEEEN